MDQALINLALTQFQKTLISNIEAEWSHDAGTPSEWARIAFYENCPEKSYTSAIPDRLWKIVKSDIEEIAPVSEAPKPREDGMFYDYMRGWFAWDKKHEMLSINWQAGPRFGRGFLHTVARSPKSTYYITASQATWVS